MASDSIKRNGKRGFPKSQKRQKPRPLSEEERKEATARAQAGRVSARANKEAEYFWSCVREQFRWRDAPEHTPLTVSLKLSLGSHLGLAFDPETLSLLEVEGQGRTQLRDAATAAAAKAGLSIYDGAHKGEDVGESESGGDWDVPVSSWKIKGVGGIPVATGPEFVGALQSCRDRGEEFAFVQLREKEFGEAAKLASAVSLFGHPLAHDQHQQPAATRLPQDGGHSSKAAADVVRTGAGESLEEVPPLEDFREIARQQQQEQQQQQEEEEQQQQQQQPQEEEVVVDVGVLPDFLARNLVDPNRMGFRDPTPIQQHCVPLGLAELDVLACAETGSGKTVAFLLPVIASLAAGKGPTRPGGPTRLPKERAAAAGRPRCLSRARRTPCRPAALVLAPTRELAQQIEKECAKMCFEAPPPLSGSGRWCTAVYGGARAKPQLLALSGGVEVLVATPGRLTEFLSSGLVSLDRCTHLVLDEADRMLDMGFEHELSTIVESSDLPPKAARQTMLFSATFVGPVRRAAAGFLRSPFAHVTVGAVAGAGAGGGRLGGGGGGSSSSSSPWGSNFAVAVQSVAQRVVPVESGDRRAKLGALVELLLADGSRHDKGDEEEFKDGKEAPAKGKELERTIVFVERKKDAAWLARQLNGLAHFGGSGILVPLEDAAAAAAAAASAAGEAKAKAQGGAPPSSRGSSLSVESGDGQEGGSEPGKTSNDNKKEEKRLPPGAVAVVGGAKPGGLVCELHGDRSQSQRDTALRAFRQGSCRVLVCTDVGSRGLDVPAVDHVVQFDLPTKRDDFETYIHRVGRTGRAGLSGRATSLFVAPPGTLKARYQGEKLKAKTDVSAEDLVHQGSDEGVNEVAAAAENEAELADASLLLASLPRMRVKELREHLKARGLDASGKKLELAGRLRGALAAEGAGPKTSEKGVGPRRGRHGQRQGGGGEQDGDDVEVWGRNDMAVWRELKRTLKEGGHPLPKWFLDLSQHTRRADASSVTGTQPRVWSHGPRGKPGGRRND